MSKEIKYKCWDPDCDTWIYDDGGDETDFQFKDGKWKVKYTKEIRMMNGDIEMDVPVWREVEEPIVVEASLEVWTI